jgi:hypothetical protein
LGHSELAHSASRNVQDSGRCGQSAWAGSPALRAFDAQISEYDLPFREIAAASEPAETCFRRWRECNRTLDLGDITV